MAREEQDQETGEKILKLDIDRWAKWLQFSQERDWIIALARKQGYEKIKHGEKTLWTRSKGISL